MWKTGFKNPPRQTALVWGRVQCRAHIDFFFAPTHRPVGKKHYSLTLNTKHNYMDGIGTAYTSHNKEIFLHGKRLKINFKINKSD